jgi:signal peptidase I
MNPYLILGSLMHNSPSRESIPKNTLLYRGHSMSPTFVDLDLLSYVPLQNGSTQPGDVIAFQHPNDDMVIVHRVISMEGMVLRTQGDNNVLPDPYSVDLSSVVGIICERQSNRKIARVSGGSKGLIRFLYIQKKKKAFLVWSNLIYPLYRLMVAHRVISRFSTHLIPRKIETLRRNEGIEYQLWCFGTLAGVQPPGSFHWHLMVPFPLFIDEATLMTPDLLEEFSVHGV